MPKWLSRVAVRGERAARWASVRGLACAGTAAQNRTATRGAGARRTEVRGESHMDGPRWCPERTEAATRFAGARKGSAAAWAIRRQPRAAQKSSLWVGCSRQAARERSYIRVVSLEAWRAASWTAASGTPRSSRRVTKVWRRRCGLTPSTWSSPSPTRPACLRELAEQAVDRLAVVGDARGGRAGAQPAAVLAAEDRALGARADGLEDRALGAVVERDVDVLAALAAHDQRVAAAGLAVQVLDVGRAQLGHAQAVEQQQADHRLGLVAALGGDRQQPPHLVVGDGAAAGLAPQLRALDAGRGRAGDDAALGEVVVEGAHRGELARDRRGCITRAAVGGGLAVGPDQLGQPVAVAVDVRAADVARVLVAAGQPGQEDREVAGVARARQRRQLRREEVVEQVGELVVGGEGDGVRGHEHRIPRRGGDSFRIILQNRDSDQ